MTELKDGHVRVRMYNVGFGDCFLILIPGDPVRTILVDAGFHSQGKGSFSSKELTRQVLDDLIAYTGKPRADVVIGTHRHQDHITSFNDKQWSELQIGEVWLPWVDNPKDKVAKKLWKKKTSFAFALTEALPAFAATMSKEAKNDTAFMLWNAGVPYDALAKFAGWPAAIDPVFGVSNSEALAILRTGFASRDVEDPRYLPATNAYPETFESDVLPDVRVHVLGPPKDPDYLDEGDPVGDGESYKELAASESTPEDVTEMHSPPAFAKRWVMREDAVAESPITSLERRELVKFATRLDPLLAATHLDDMINATSLVLVLQIGKARLLLTGDAEWGTWKYILAEPKAVALLKGTTFVKVGHHGSHNATPKTLVDEILPSSVLAMVSTQEGPGKYRNNIPLKPLMKALVDKGIVHCRSDRAADLDDDAFTPHKELWIDVDLPM
jgi:beta-lactamase superfamily II metal-dependent hydrolase